MSTNVSEWKALKSVCLGVYLCCCMPESVFLHAYRQAGWQATVTMWQQPTTLHFWLRQALQLHKPALPRGPSFLSIDGMTGLHPLTHTPLSPSLLLWCTCLPALQASSTRIKGAELFSSRKLIQHLSPGFILGIEDCALCECECTVCVREAWKAAWGFFERERETVLFL